MKGLFEDDKMILRREVLFSVLGWAVLGYCLIGFLNVLGMIILGLEGIPGGIGLKLSLIGSGLLFFTLIPMLALGIIFYAALRKNWKRFNLMDYRFKLTYLAYIFLFIAAFDVFLTLIITKRLEFPHFGILSLIALFAVPRMVRN